MALLGQVSHFRKNKQKSEYQFVKSSAMILFMIQWALGMNAKMQSLVWLCFARKIAIYIILWPHMTANIQY